MLTNSVLTLVTAPSGALTASGDPSGRTTLWSGRAPAYLKRERHTTVADGANIVVALDVLTVLDSAGGPPIVLAGADWEAGRVTVIDQRAKPYRTRAFTVDRAEHRAAGTIADSLRLELSAESA